MMVKLLSSKLAKGRKAHARIKLLLYKLQYITNQEAEGFTSAS